MAAVDASAAVVLLDLDDTLLYEQRTVPGILAAAARLFRTPARACLMVGNSLEHDIAGARAAGMRAVWFAHEEVPGTPPAAAAGVPPDHVIGSLPELLVLPAVRRAPR